VANSKDQGNIQFVRLFVCTVCVSVWQLVAS